MEFDKDNKIIKLCVEGMELEGRGYAGEAAEIFLKAWNEASNKFEKFTSAHYVARHQKSVAEKLKWDKTALALALTLEGDTVRSTLASLYLNIAKCYEDLNDFENAKKHYQFAFSFSVYLPDNGYGRLIKEGIINGMERLKLKG